MKRKTLSGQRGVAVIEAAITLIPFFVFLFAVVEAGWFFYVQQTITDAAREGAKFAVLPFTKTDNLPADTDIQDLVDDYLSTAGIHCAATCVAINHETVNVCSSTPGCNSGNLNRRIARVTVTVPYTLITLSMFQSLSFNMTGEAWMREEVSQY
jgi:Flp pilus assembly protein TadG